MDDQQNNCYENMNYNNSLNNEDHDQLVTSTRKSLKKATKLLLSVSVFSLLLTYSSSLYPIFIHAFRSNSLFSHNIQVLLTHIQDKNFTFLICNGILVFLAKTSGLLRSRSRLDHHRRIKNINVVGMQMDHPATGTPLEELQNFDNQDITDVGEYSSLSPDCPLKEAPAPAGWDSTNHDEYLPTEGSKIEEQGREAKVAEVEEIGYLSTGVGGGSQEDHTNYSFSNDKINKRGSESSFLSCGKEDAEEMSRLESSALVSTEELNKRFDEFIVKMKERLRIEAAGQKLIMA